MNVTRNIRGRVLHIVLVVEADGFGATALLPDILMIIPGNS